MPLFLLLNHFLIIIINSNLSSIRGYGDNFTCLFIILLDVDIPISKILYFVK